MASRGHGFGAAKLLRVIRTCASDDFNSTGEPVVGKRNLFLA